MNFWRLVFLLSHFGVLEASKWFLYVRAFPVGLRLDGVVASALMLPLVVMLIIKIILSKETVYKYFSYAYFFLISLLISLINIVDVFLFQEFDTHLSFLVLSTQFFQKDTMSFIFEEYPVYPAMAMLLLFTGGIFMLYGKVDTVLRDRSSSISIKLSSALLSVITLGTLMRGGWQERPIDWGHAMFSPDLIANQTALSSLFFLGRSVVQFSSESNSHDMIQYYDTEEAFQTTRKLLEDPGASYMDGVSLKRQLNTQTDEGYNIVLVILESHSAAFVGYLNSENQSVTPNLDRMGKLGFAFTNCYSNGVRSAHGMSSIIMGWPNLPGLPLISRVESVNQAPSLGNALKAVGYNTTFLYGGDSQFDNMKGFLSSNGFDRVIDRNEFSSKAQGTKWGVYDHTVFDRALEELDRSSKPALLTLFTTTNHQPWEIPSEYEASIPVFPDSLVRKGAVHRSMAYVDHVLGEFMEKASQRAWYNNSIFVFIADHGLTIHKSTLAKIQNAHIPFVIYAPGLDLEPRIIEQPVSQADVAPTILGLIDYTLPYTFFGQNALSLESGFACKIAGGEAYWLQDDYLYFERFGQEASLYKIQYPLDPELVRDVSKLPVFKTYQRNFRSYLQTGSTQFKALGQSEN